MSGFFELLPERFPVQARIIESAGTGGIDLGCRAVEFVVLPVLDEALAGLPGGHSQQQPAREPNALRAKAAKARAAGRCGRSRRLQPVGQRSREFMAEVVGEMSDTIALRFGRAIGQREQISRYERRL